MLLLFVTVVCLPLMLLLAGMAVDLGALGVLRGKLLVAADSASTAGASAIAFQKTDKDCVKNCAGAWVVDLDIAREYARRNGYEPDRVDL